jgi:hypothetical protein
VAAVPASPAAEPLDLLEGFGLGGEEEAQIEDGATLCAVFEQDSWLPRHWC